ncbi:MAG: aminotransferase class I/II-fold pyridoxal phosphate-dependent enzyme [Candidatus Omnitrophica bacterium]|nr:aminotransferase class I/II-fold pyridoxal phosphate-dependent enzyme [Candidatus Omnitrophota bacterium]MDD4012795.1 aminotransferase class I/II-fold pyridoxal phosphate-dependent enzyme [Candidatus Omnitrophota bacterium]
MSKKILLDAPNIGKTEKIFVNRAIDSGYVSTVGPFVPDFEERFACLIGVKKAVSTQSGTAALHMALYETGVGPGDEVIVPALTFVASVNPILYVGAKPVFVDVDPGTWNMSPEEFAKNITGRTKAVIPVHLYGNPCKMDDITKIARAKNIAVIEDATESLGALYKGRHTGTFGEFGCFSFNGNKTITTGGGGMVVGKSAKRIDHIKFLVNQSREGAKGYYHPEIGFNLRMTNIEAALGLAQINRFKGLLKIKKRIHVIFREELASEELIVFQDEYPGAHSSRWLTCVCFRSDIRVEDIRNKLAEKGVPTRRVFMPIWEFPPYKKAERGDMSNTRAIYRNGLCLPSSTLNGERDIMRAAKEIRTILRKV